jgi:hypothetical protein
MTKKYKSIQDFSEFRFILIIISTVNINLTQILYN